MSKAILVRLHGQTNFLPSRLSVSIDGFKTRFYNRMIESIEYEQEARIRVRQYLSDIMPHFMDSHILHCAWVPGNNLIFAPEFFLHGVPSEEARLRYEAESGKEELPI